MGGEVETKYTKSSKTIEKYKNHKRRKVGPRKQTVVRRKNFNSTKIGNITHKNQDPETITYQELYITKNGTTAN